MPDVWSLDHPTIIERISKGERMSAIAKECGVDKRRLSQALRQYQAYHLAKQAKAIHALQSAQERIRAAKTAQDIRSSVRAYRFEAFVQRVSGTNVERHGLAFSIPCYKCGGTALGLAGGALRCITCGFVGDPRKQLRNDLRGLRRRVARMQRRKDRAKARSVSNAQHRTIESDT